MKYNANLYYQLMIFFYNPSVHKKQIILNITNDQCNVSMTNNKKKIVLFKLNDLLQLNFPITKFHWGGGGLLNSTNA